MEYLVTAYDGKDAGAKERRLNARQAHLDNARLMKENGSFISGGAILDENGEMIGSTLHVEFESKELLDNWIKTDPYVTGNVWVDIDILPIKLALRD